MLDELPQLGSLVSMNPASPCFSNRFAWWFYYPASLRKGL